MNVLDFLGSQAGRVIRVVLGLAMIGVGVALGGGWWALAAVGVLPILTGALDVCLIAPLLGRPLKGAALRAGR